jgi:hypothetical protein
MTQVCLAEARPKPPANEGVRASRAPAAAFETGRFAKITNARADRAPRRESGGERGRLAVSTTDQDPGANAIVSVVMPLRLQRELAARAEANERSLSAEARIAVRAHLKHNGGQSAPASRDGH